jgi:hypothetical protein
MPLPPHAWGFPQSAAIACCRAHLPPLLHFCLPPSDIRHRITCHQERERESSPRPQSLPHPFNNNSNTASSLPPSFSLPFLWACRHQASPCTFQASSAFTVCSWLFFCRLALAWIAAGLL